MSATIKIEDIKVIGEGATSLVYLLDTVGETRAIKILKKEVFASNPAASLLFRQEVSILAKLNSAYFPRVFDAGEMDGLPYISLEYIASTPLDKFLKAGPLSEIQLMTLALGLARGLAELHRFGAIHRDLKPANIFFNGTDNLKIIDLGFGGELAGDLGSREGIGTIQYCAPEQLKGEGVVDSRTDLYSLGAVLYECATGVVPFSGQTSEILKSKMEGVYLAPEKIRPTLSNIFSQILGKMLEANPKDRYQTAEGLIHDLKFVMNPKISTEPIVLDKLSKSVSRVSANMLVGREHELELVGEIWKKLIAGEGQTIFVEAESGCGKTRLVNEFLQQTSENKSLIFRGKCQRSDQVPFGVLRECVDYCLSRVARLPEAERAKLEEIIASAVVDTGRLVQTFTGSLEQLLRKKGLLKEGAAEINDQQRFMDAVKDFFIELSTHGIVILYLDDIQWIDLNSTQVLFRIAHHLKDKNFLILGTSRNQSENVETLEKIRAGLVGTPFTRIQLSRLSAKHCEELIRNQLGGRPMASNLTPKLMSICDGNPFSTIEILRSMVESGIVAIRNEIWEFDEVGLSQSKISTDLATVLLNRLAGLGPATLEVLSTAALNHKALTPNLIHFISKGSKLEVSRIIKEALTSGVLEQKGEDELGFIHDKVTEALVSRLSIEKKKESHQILVNYLESVPKDQQTIDDAFALAHHYLSGDIESNNLGAIKACVRAGEVALTSFSFEKAYELFHRADQLGSNIEVGIEVIEKLALSGLRTGRINVALEKYRYCLKKSSTKVEKAKYNFLIAQSLLAGGNAEEAWISLVTSLRLFGVWVPNQKWVLYLIGFLYFLFGYLIELLGVRRWVRTDVNKRKLISQLIPTATQITYYLNRIDLNVYFCAREYVNSYFVGVSSERAVSLAYCAHAVGSFHLRRLVKFFGRKSINIAGLVGNMNSMGQCHFQYGMGLQASGETGEGCKQFDICISKFKTYTGYREYSTFLGAYSLILVQQNDSRRIIELGREHLDFLRKSGNVAMYVTFVGNYYSLLLLTDAKEEIQALKIEWESIAPLASKNSMSNSVFYGVSMWTALHSKKYSGIDKIIESHYQMRFAVPYTKGFYVLSCYLRREQFETSGMDLKSAHWQGFILTFTRAKPLCKVALQLCHIRIFEAYIARKKGQFRRGQRLILEAKKYAEQANSNWGRYEALLEEAQIALEAGGREKYLSFMSEAKKLAENYGWYHRSKSIVISESAKETLASKVGSIEDKRCFDAVLRVSLAVSSSLVPEEQLRSALDELIDILQAERAFLFLLDEKTGKIKTQAGRDSNKKNIIQLTGFSSTVVKKVLEKQVPLLVSGTDDSEISSAQSIVANNLRSIIASPLLHKGKLIGAVYLDSRVAKGIFGQEDFKILTTIGSFIALSLETIRSTLEKKDLEVTKFVQTLLLPKKMDLEAGSLKIAGYYNPVLQSGGDWIWYEKLSANRLRIVLGDVTGHGAGSAMVAATIVGAYQALREKGLHGEDGDQILQTLNDVLYQACNGEFLMTMSITEIDNENNRIRLWSAGAPPVFLTSSKTYTLLQTDSGTPLGTSQLKVSLATTNLSKEQTVFVFSDGLYEFKTKNGAQLGLKRLGKLLTNTNGQFIPVLRRDSIVEHIGQLCGESGFEDDITFAVIQSH